MHRHVTSTNGLMTSTHNTPNLRPKDKESLFLGVSVPRWVKVIESSVIKSCINLGALLYYRLTKEDSN